MPTSGLTSGDAKGFPVDQALEVLRGSGAASGLVNAGGNLPCSARRPERFIFVIRAIPAA